ncbi:MAG: hypothetical protein M1830_000427 [Pleopsidium flavum]|nr:MAG: hypothetical protein M1830_000427 [Pleopsidium flavum]
MEKLFEKPVVSVDSAVRYSGSEDNLEPIDRAAEKRLLLKLDLHVLPMITLLYMLAFVDRINIGNARIQGLEKDLHMKGQDYNIALFMFFIPYILLEVPSNILLKKVPPSTWLSFIMFCWGVITVCMGVTKSYAGLVVCRFLLGVFEAGFFPGCLYLISMYYKRYELQWRFNLFFCAAILAGAWGGLFAYALANMAGVGGYNGWRWIFIIEGLLTIVVAVIGKFFIVDWPETSKFLNPDERNLLLRRLSEEVAEAQMDTLDKASIRRILTDWKIYVGSVPFPLLHSHSFLPKLTDPLTPSGCFTHRTIMYFGVVTTGYATSFFTPTILHQLGWTSIRAQVLSIPIYIAATCTTLLTALLSDRLHHRFLFSIAGVLIATTGYVLLLAQTHHVPVAARYFALYLITSGAYITQPITLTWLANNLSGHYKRAVAVAVQIGFGNAGGIVASNIFITSQAPTYPVGFGVSLALLWLSAACCVGFWWGLRRENGRRERGERDWRLGLPEGERGNLGDDWPRFRFGY